jgi:hypothetical protein
MGATVEELPEDVIRKELGPAEKLLWSGRPPQGWMLRPSDWAMIPFSILWGGFAIFWEASVIDSGAPFFFALWGIPFVLVGLYMIFGRFYFEARQRAVTYYGVTSERVIIISGLFSRSTKSLSIDTLSDVSLNERPNSISTITFGPVPFLYYWYAGTSWPGTNRYMIPSFELSTDARNVYDIIRTAQREAKKSA